MATAPRSEVRLTPRHLPGRLARTPTVVPIPVPTTPIATTIPTEPMPIPANATPRLSNRPLPRGLNRTPRISANERERKEEKVGGERRSPQPKEKTQAEIAPTPAKRVVTSPRNAGVIVSPITGKAVPANPTSPKIPAPFPAIQPPSPKRTVPAQPTSPKRLSPTQPTKSPQSVIPKRVPPPLPAFSPSPPIPSPPLPLTRTTQLISPTKTLPPQPQIASPKRQVTQLPVQPAVIPRLPTPTKKGKLTQATLQAFFNTPIPKKAKPASPRFTPLKPVIIPPRNVTTPPRVPPQVRQQTPVPRLLPQRVSPVQVPPVFQPTRQTLTPPRQTPPQIAQPPQRGLYPLPPGTLAPPPLPPFLIGAEALQVEQKETPKRVSPPRARVSPPKVVAPPKVVISPKGILPRSTVPQTKEKLPEPFNRIVADLYAAKTPAEVFKITQNPKAWIAVPPKIAQDAVKARDYYLAELLDYWIGFGSPFKPEEHKDFIREARQFILGAPNWERTRVLEPYPDTFLLERIGVDGEWSNRAQLLTLFVERILDDQPHWSWHHGKCNNDDTINILEGDKHGTINKDDPDDPTLSYGTLENYACYQASELQASFREYNNVFRFQVPDDPTSKQAFPTKSVEQLLRLLDATPGAYQVPTLDKLAATIIKGLRYSTEADKNVANLKNSIKNLSPKDQELIEQYLVELFLLGMYLRRWKGPAFVFPHFWTEDEKQAAYNAACTDAERDEVVGNQKHKLDGIEQKMSAAAFSLMSTLPRYRYNWQTQEAFPAIEEPGIRVDQRRDRIRYVLNRIIPGRGKEPFCLAEASDIIAGSSYYLINKLYNLHNAGFNQLLKKYHPGVGEFEPKIVEVTQHRDPNHRDVAYAEKIPVIHPGATVPRRPSPTAAAPRRPSPLQIGAAVRAAREVAKTVGENRGGTARPLSPLAGRAPSPLTQYQRLFANMGIVIPPRLPVGPISPLRGTARAPTTISPGSPMGEMPEEPISPINPQFITQRRKPKPKEGKVKQETPEERREQRGGVVIPPFTTKKNKATKATRPVLPPLPPLLARVKREEKEEEEEKGTLPVLPAITNPTILAALKATGKPTKITETGVKIPKPKTAKPKTLKLKKPTKTYGLSTKFIAFLKRNHLDVEDYVLLDPDRQEEYVDFWELEKENKKEEQKRKQKKK